MHQGGHKEVQSLLLPVVKVLLRQCARARAADAGKFAGNVWQLWVTRGLGEGGLPGRLPGTPSH